jgi:hypothetical protein
MESVMLYVSPSFVAVSSWVKCRKRLENRGFPLSFMPIFDMMARAGTEDCGLGPARLATTNLFCRKRPAMTARNSTIGALSVQGYPPFPCPEGPWSWAFFLFRPIDWARGYGVDTDGNVWTCLPHGKTLPIRYVPWRKLRPFVTSRGVKRVAIHADGKRFGRAVHTLVLEAFVGPRPPGMEACHFPVRDPSNCCLWNLRWDTHVGNCADKEYHGTSQRGERAGSARLTNEDVLEIRRLFGEGLGYKRIARRFNCSPSTIARIKRGQSWGAAATGRGAVDDDRLVEAYSVVGCELLELPYSESMSRLTQSIGVPVIRNGNRTVFRALLRLQAAGRLPRLAEARKEWMT